MRLARAEKLRPFLAAWEPHTVATSARLRRLGITAQDVQNYVSTGWLQALGRGAYKRPHETVTWQGALYSLQSQLDLPVHIGALTALELSGRGHYLRFGGSIAYLFSPPAIALPLWFRTHWGTQVRHVQSGFLPATMGLTERDGGEGFPLKAATPERAILEMLHLAPNVFDLVESFSIVEGMTTLRPALMQQLLEACGSVKVKRLFLYFAERADLPIMRHLDAGAIDLGKGDRSLTRMGRYVAKYRLLLPKELVGSGG